MDTADLREKPQRRVLLVAALVVAHDLVGFVPARLDSHAESMVLGDIVLVVADVIAKKHLAVGVHHLVHACSALVSVLITVVEVQLRAVAIPEAVTTARKDGPVLAVITLVRLHFPIDRIIPQRFDTRAVEPFAEATGTLQRLPATFRSDTVVLLEDLHVSINRNAAAFQCYKVTPAVLLDLQRVAVAVFTAHKHTVVVGTELVYQGFQTPHTARKAVPVHRTPFLTRDKQKLPKVTAETGQLVIG